MGTEKRKAGIVALIMAGIVFAAVIITVLTGVSREGDKRLNIVASFYPMYGAALQLTEGVDGADVVNLTPNQTGCLHDYQLTPDDVISLKNADVLVLNGAGAESFLGEEIASQYPDLAVLDTSAGIALIKGEEEHHEEHHDEETGHHHEGAYNEHIWTSPSNYIKQIENLRDGLIKADPDFAEKYRANADEYMSKIEALKKQLVTAAEALPTKNCILFHGSLEYLAQDLGLKPIASFAVGEEESAISAADLAKAAEAASASGKVLLLYDSQYDADYAFVAKDTVFSRAIKMDTAVTDRGGYAGDSWLNAMEKNLRLFKEAAK